MKLARAWTRWLTARTKPIRKGSPSPTTPRRSFPLRLTPLEDRVTPASVDLSVTKSENLTAVNPGDTITYTVVASNNDATNPATAASLTDTFPTGQFSNVTYTSAVTAGVATGNTAAGTGDINDTLDLGPSSSVTYTILATVANTATGPVTNTANIAPGPLDTDPVATNNSATVSANMNVDVGVSKTGTPAHAAPGQTVTYTITVTNAGTSTATNVHVTDTLPAGMTAGTFSGNGHTNTVGPLSDTINSLAPGASVVYTETATVNAAAAGPLTDTAAVSVPAGQTDTNAANNTSQASTLVNVDLGITKSVSPAGAAPGSNVTYTITVSNAPGSGTATNVAVTDTLPAGLTNVQWAGSNGSSGTGNTLNDTITTLAPGADVVYTITAHVDNGVTLPLSNTATITPDNTADFDTNPTNNTATATLRNAVDLSVTKTDNVTTAAPGDTITYTIVASNAGPQTATAATLTDTFPAAEFSSVSYTSTATTGVTGNTAGPATGDISDTLTIPSGGSVTYIVTATVAAAAAGSLTNTAAVAAGPTDADTNTANNSATDTDTVKPVTVDLSVTKTDGSTTTSGGTVTYTITVSNAGPGTATGATLTDTFPTAEFGSVNYTSTTTGGATGNTAAGTGDISDTLSLPSGATVVYTVTATLASGLAGPVTNTATVTPGANDTDTNPANNTATDTDLIGTTVTLTSLPNPSTLGQAVTLTATVTGLGGANPTAGTVEFVSNGTVIGTGTLSGTNVATLTTSALPAGTDAITAVFLGTAGAAPSASTPVIQVVSSGGGGAGALALTRNLIVGGATNGTVVVYVPNGSGQYVQGATDAPFGNIGTDVRGATGDVDGDGTEDYILVTGPGTAIRVMVLSGKTGSVLVAPFDPFGGNFVGGGFVSAADFDKDGRAEFVVTPDQGGGPRVSIFSLLTTGLTLRANFFGIDDPNFRGGARTGAGDVNNDGTPDLAVAAGFEGGPRVALYNGTTLLSGAPTKLLNDFFVFESTLRNGAFVTIGDIDGDGFGDLIAGAGPGGGPRVLALSGKTLLDQGAVAAIASPLANFFVNNTDTDRGGVRVAAKNLDGDNKADLVVGTGNDRPARVRVYHGANITPTGEPTGFQDLDPFGGAVLADGVFVG